ncbi:alpha/beta fold hydrolase [Streptomyces sp. NPDC001904]|uniref:alpha/beta fold hydrolase n=1 Tax=Streptomyces sp. NPDC001904 TaxID=3154531 RepID=UPI0033204EBC
MTTVVFIHGTGVREPRFGALHARTVEGLGATAPHARVVPFYWGGAHGAVLAARGASIPEPAGGTTRGPDDGDETDAWARLYEDPEAELAFAAAGAGTAVTAPGAEFPDERPRRLLRRIGDVAPELGRGLPIRAAELARSPLLAPAAAALDPDELARLLARALAAAVIGAALDADTPVLCTGEVRDAAVDRIAEALGATPEGTGRGLFLRTVKRPLMRAGSRAAVRRRRALTEAVHPAAGDILRYLARGAELRRALRDLIAGQEPPVVLLGHSLGGIIALDTLVLDPQPSVALLVTVGSQAPFLYETGALPSLTHPQPLPPHVPDWLNLYDRRDLLGYVGAGLFPGRVTDVATDSRQPFPVAHSAYWDDPAVYRAIAARLP